MNSIILWGFTYCIRQANGRSFSISPRNISTCFASLDNLTCGVMTSDIRKNHEGDAECRLYDWVVIPLTPPWTPGWCRWLLARRRLEAPTALADNVVSAPEPTPLAEMGRLAGSRWSLAACREATTGEVGRDQSDGRLGSARDRHITRAR
jgi:hypothetical protein